MPTIRIEVKDGLAILNVAVSQVGGTPTVEYGALIDTGAQISAISSRAANDVGLIAIGLRTITPVSGQPFPTLQYRARLDIPIGPDLRGKSIDVVELPYQPSDYDLILGMDFLSSAHISIWRQWLILST